MTESCHNIQSKIMYNYKEFEFKILMIRQQVSVQKQKLFLKKSSSNKRALRWKVMESERS